MKNMVLCLILLSAAAGCDARGFFGIADVSIIDRDSGVTLTPHYYRGEYWVAGTPGARYAIEIRNRLGERLLAVTSVDGVNVVSGENAAWNQAGYVFSPGESYQIRGWRKSEREVAAFTFTNASNSYAERTGRPGNIGVIGVAVFRERPPEPVYTSPRIGGQAPNREGVAADAAQAPAARAQSEAPMPSAVARLTAPAAGAGISAQPLVEALGTGHGEREYSYAQHTNFVRLRPTPDEIIRIRYDSLENLEAMGIIARRGSEAPKPNPFPAAPSPGYVPDPPG